VNDFSPIRLLSRKRLKGVFDLARAKRQNGWANRGVGSRLRRVPSAESAAVRALQSLYNEVFADLDTDCGGISWMRDQLDWQRACLIGNYFMSTILGVQSSLRVAASSAKRYRESEHADNWWLSNRWDQTRKQPGATPSDLMRDLDRDEKAAEREVEMLAAADHCFHHLVQGLDRLAVCIAVTAALRVKLLKFDWDELDKFARERAGKGHDVYRQTAAGEAEQLALLSLVVDEPAKHGPTDWLPWLLGARNTVTHRPPKTHFALLTSDRRRPTGLTRPFHRQPDWPEMEALLTSRQGGIFEMILNDEPTSTLNGLTRSVCGLVEILAKQCTTLVLKRRANPSLLVQSGHQWIKRFNQPLLNFPGYGTRPRASMDRADIHVNPDLGRRMRAFRMLDARAGDWEST
jgi:hypothetical protein